MHPWSVVKSWLSLALGRTTAAHKV
eukprot:COSAG03_NODE_19630_length_333_cov_0.811966_1_plen_24_part_01